MSKKKFDKVLIITDSLGLPRKEPEFVSVENCWPYMLRRTLEEQGKDVYIYSIGGYDTSRLAQELDYSLSAFDPDLTIIQVGIVDCFPRAFKKSELLFLKFLAKMGIKTRSFTKKIEGRLRDARNLTYTPKTTFVENLRIIKEKCSSDVIWVKILPATDEYKIISNKVELNINLYNKEIGRLFEIVDPYLTVERLSDCVMSDQHHLNNLGHKHVYECLSKEII